MPFVNTPLVHIEFPLNAQAVEPGAAAANMLGAIAFGNWEPDFTVFIFQDRLGSSRATQLPVESTNRFPQPCDAGQGLLVDVNV